ncbi:energy transducer TonB, partial [Plastoroseomonas arctica]
PQPRPAQPAPPALAGTRFIPDASLGPLRPPQAAPAPQRRPNPDQLALGPNPRPDRPNPPAARSDENVAGATLRISGANLGADWRAAFMEWLRRNGRYPREAAMNGEDGTTIVRFEVDRDGRVQSVRLTSRSGSQWLDIASTALLRDRTIPPFPPGTESNLATIDLTIQYILVRR